MPRSEHAMNEYQHEQLTALELTRSRPDILTAMRDASATSLAEYHSFREQTDRFLQRHFRQVCTDSCYQNRLSACCGKDSIVIFFADVVINALAADTAALEAMAERLRRPNSGFKCVYLADRGCMWTIKPIVCQMFLCDTARRQGFSADLTLERQWEAFEMARKKFTWPDQPVLFDHIESAFLEAGLRSSLMHLHLSPGLLRIKRLAGLSATRAAPTGPGPESN